MRHAARGSLRPSLGAWLTRAAVLLGLLSGLGCASSNPNVRVRRLPSGFLEVEGPLAGPFATLEDLTVRACEVMTGQPGAANGNQGLEYCALHYYSPKTGGYFLSYLSDVGGSRSGGVKYCKVPRSIDDSANPDAIILGPAHTHPHNRKFSARDLSSDSHWYPTRFVDQATGRVFDRQLLMFFREKTGECRAYSYNNVTLKVSALRDGTWVPIGRVSNDQGTLELFDGMDWLP